MKKKNLSLLVLSLLASQSFAIEQKNEIETNNTVYKITVQGDETTLTPTAIYTQFKNIDGEIDGIKTNIDMKNNIKTISFKNTNALYGLNGQFYLKKKDGLYLNNQKIEHTNKDTYISINKSNLEKNRFVLLLNKNETILYYPDFNYYKNLSFSLQDELKSYLQSKEITVNDEKLNEILKTAEIKTEKDRDNGIFKTSLLFKSLPKEISDSGLFELSFTTKQNINDSTELQIDYIENNSVELGFDNESYDDTELLPMTLKKYNGKDIHFEDYDNFFIKNNILFKKEKCVSGVNQCFDTPKAIALYKNNLSNKNIVKAEMKDDTAYILYETGQLDVFNTITMTVEDRLFNILDIEDNTLIKAIAKGMKQSNKDIENITEEQIKTAERNELTTSFDLDIVNVPDYDDMFSFYVDSYPVYSEDYFHNDVKDYLKK